MFPNILEILLPISCPPKTKFTISAESGYQGIPLGYRILHVIEGDTSGARVPPFDYFAIKRLFGGLFMANTGFDTGRANEAIAQGRAELVAFGKPFIGNPNLVTRLYFDVPLSPLNRETLNGGTEQGYTDYPVLRTVAPHACHADAERAWG